MALSSSNNYSGGGNSNDGAVVFVGLGIIGLAAWPVVVLFSISAFLSVLVALYVVVSVIFMLVADGNWVRFVLGLSIVLALLLTPVCFVARSGLYHWMGGAITGLYLLALVIGLWSALGAALKFLAGLFAVVLISVFLILPAPEAARSSVEQDKWRVELTALDDQGQPVEGAVAQCSTIMFWERDRKFEFRMTLLQKTDENGKVKLTLSADTRFKLALCGATKPATENEPGFALRSGIVANPFRGGTFPLTIVLDQRLAPGSAPDGLPQNYDDYVASGE